MVEALALRRAVVLAAELGCDSVIFESDSLELVQAVKCMKVNAYWECTAILEEIVPVLNLNDNFSIASIGRESNSAADWLARSVLRGVCPLGWVVSPPPPLAVILRKDCSLLDDDVGIG